MKNNTGGVPVSYRLAVASRVLAAVLGGYVLTSLVSICVALSLPMARSEAVLVSLMTSFVFYLLAILWCFACRSAGRAWAGMALPSLVLAAIWGVMAGTVGA